MTGQRVQPGGGIAAAPVGRGNGALLYLIAL
jgi:hypothetical protein